MEIVMQTASHDWCGVADIGTWLAKYSKRYSETQVSYALKKHHKVVICRSIQNGWVFKMVAVSTGWAIAVDNAFNASETFW